MRTKQVNAFVRVTLVPVTGSPVLWQASTRTLADPPTYFDGKKRGLIVSFGDAERALSDNRGAYEVPTFSFTLDDRTGFWRALLNDPNTQYLTSSDVMYILVSEAGRIAEVVPRTEFRGQLEHPAPLAGKKFSVGAQSRLGTRYGPVNLQSKMNKAVYNLVDWPKLPRDFENKTVPMLWGEQSDKGVVNAADAEIAKGRIIPTYCGEVFQGATTGTPPTAPTFLPDPPAPTFIRIGSGGSSTWDIAASVRTANGHTRLGPSLRITNVPSNGHWTGGETDPNATPVNGGSIHLAAYSAALMAEVTGADLWARQVIGGVEGAWHLVDAAGQMFNTAANEFFNGPAGYMANGDDSFLKASPPPPDTNTAQVIPGAPGVAPHSYFYGFFGFLRHKGKITTLYGSNLAEKAEYVAISASEIGVDYTSGKNFLFGPDGTGVELVINGHTYWGFFAKDPKAEAHKSGTMPFRANICGWHEDNDVTKPIIDQAALVYQDVFTQLAGNNGEGYQSGARLTIPNFAVAPTNPLTQSTTFENVQDVTKLYMGDDKGYVACVYIDDDRTWGDFIQGYNGDFQFDSGENCFGQILCSIMNDMLLPTDGIVLAERRHIKVVNDAGAVADDEIENDTDYEYDKHPIEGKFLSGVKNIQNALSISKYGRRPGPKRSLQYIRDPKTADDTTKRYHLHRIVGPMYPSVTLKMKRAANVEIGDQVILEHRDLIAPQVPIYVRRRKFSYSGREIVVTGRARTADTYASQAAPDDTIGTNSSDATAEERILYGFATDDNGLLPDGSAGAMAR